MAASNDSSSLDALVGFCRRELAAVESYRKALSSLPDGSHTPVLASCLRSHEERAEFFKTRIRVLHAEPPASAGMRGAVVKALESAAAVIGVRMAIAALEDEEERLTRHYRTHLRSLDRESRELAQQRLIPAQLETERQIKELKHAGQTTASTA